MKQRRRFSRKLKVNIKEENQIQLVLRLMVRRTKESLASQSVENPNTIQFNRKDLKRNGKLPQTSLQVDDDGKSGSGEDNQVNLVPNGQKEGHQLVLDQLSSVYTHLNMAMCLSWIHRYLQRYTHNSY